MMMMMNRLLFMTVLTHSVDAFTLKPAATTSTLMGRSSRPTLLTATPETKENEKLEASGTTKTTSTTTLDESLESKTSESDGLPWWWNLIWDLDMMKRGESGQDIIFGDIAHVLRTNIEQLYGDGPSLDGCPIAEGELSDIADGTQFIGLTNYQNTYGSPYKLLFGPKSFLVISDPVQARHILMENSVAYDKGLLAELLDPIMGKGLIPADPATWKVRRRQIVPGFHKAWLEHMVGLFGYCNQPLVEKLTKLANGATPADTSTDMESEFCSVALDIIGLSVFNYNFGSVTKESPVVKAVYRTLVEVEHRSVTPAPYWDLPLANQLVPRLRSFNADLKLLNDILDELIDRAKNTRTITDLEDLEKRNYADVQDPSLLRFLVDMRGADINNKILRDDLMTMLIAGHETTAAVLTWSLFELTRNPECLQTVQNEIDTVLGDRTPTYEDIMNMKYLRMVVAETLRMYPEPPLLIRRCRIDDELPMGGGRTATVIRGMDMFLSIYSLHRDERFWPNPNQFDPLRFTRTYTNPNIPEWKGFDPNKWEGRLYPTEAAADFAFLPFGGGARKCVGDDFATLEAIVTLAMTLRRFEFEFDETKWSTIEEGKTNDERIQNEAYLIHHPVGMRSGATIHTRYGLHMRVKQRK